MSATAPSLQVYAGPRAAQVIRRDGLLPSLVRMVPAAAGGPKGLVLNPLDRYLFGHWLRGTHQTVHLIGASIGAWRLASACAPDADAALRHMADAYVAQRYEHQPGRSPKASHVSEVFARTLRDQLGAQAQQLLSHPTRRLHVVTSRGRHLLARQARLRTPLGYLGAALSNAVHRRALGAWLERVVFSDPRDPLPLPLEDLPSHRAPLRADNLVDCVRASCSIPLWLDAVHDIAGGPAGAYWDGGITDYHLHWNYAALGDGIVLYPHFQNRLVPGWLDKAWKRRHRATRWLDNLVLLCPSPGWIQRLPAAKLPDRDDFRHFIDDDGERMRRWRTALSESQRLADEFADWVEGRVDLEVAPLP